MTKLLSRWRAAEPVRLHLYAVLIPAAALAVAYGLVTGTQVALWLALAAAGLGVPATEGARSQVTPLGAGQDDEPLERLPAPRHRAS